MCTSPDKCNCIKSALPCLLPRVAVFPGKLQGQGTHSPLFKLNSFSLSVPQGSLIHQGLGNPIPGGLREATLTPALISPHTDPKAS